MVSKLIAKTPIKIAQELKQENENEQKQKSQAELALLPLLRLGSLKRWGG